MVDYIKQDMTDIWASSGDVTAPSPAKIATGWVVEAVPRQWWNWFENRQDTNIAYMLQKGLPEWDVESEYLTNKSYVQRNGTVYRCILTNAGQDPAVAPTYWKRAFADYSAFLDKFTAHAILPSTVPYINSLGNGDLFPIGSTGLALNATTTAADARAVISAQTLNANLTALAGLSSATNKLPYFNGTNTATTTDLTAFARSLLDDVDAATARATLGVYSTTDTDTNLAIGLATKQPLSTNLTNIAGVNLNPNSMLFYNGSTNIDQTPITTYGRGFINLADAAASRTYIGANDAANLTTGLIPTARIPDSLPGKTVSFATALQTARTIQGVPFDGTANITLPVVPSTGTTGAATIPSGNTAARPGSPVNGMFRYNQDLQVFEGYQGGAWAGVAGTAGGKNRIINGACQVQQRGASVINAGQTLYGGPDRFLASNLGTTGCVFTQATGAMVVDGVTGPCLVQTINTAATNLVGGNYLSGICQAIEGFNVYDLAGKPATLSFYFVTTVAGTYSAALRIGSGAQSYVTTFVALANTIQKIIINIPVIPLGVISNNSNAGAFINIGASNYGTFVTPTLNAWASGNYTTHGTNTFWTNAVNNYIAATNIQLEEGTVATPFERLNIGTQIQQCQRYYRGQTFQFTGYQIGGNGYGQTVAHPTPMRTTPTVVTSVGTISNVTSANIQTDAVVYSFSGYATATGVCVYSGSATFNAEL